MIAFLIMNVGAEGLGFCAGAGEGAGAISDFGLSGKCCMIKNVKTAATPSAIHIFILTPWAFALTDTLQEPDHENIDLKANWRDLG